jgi:hypothetical protein
VSDPHAQVHLTFRTPAAAAVVLEQVLSAINKHGMPYELTTAGCSSFDLDEVDEEV